MIANKEIDKLNNMREKLKQVSMNTYLVDNAIELAQKYANESEVRKINVAEVEKTSSNEPHYIKKPSVRKIFINDEKDDGLIKQ